MGCGAPPLPLRVPRRPPGRSAAGLCLIATIVLGTGCERTSPRWLDLAAAAPADVHREHGRDGVFELGRLGGRPARLRHEGSETWLELELSRDDWAPSTPAGSWLAEIPDVLGPGTSPRRRSAAPERLLAPGRSFARAELDAATGFRVETDVFLRIEDALQLRLPADAEPPTVAHFGWRTTHGWHAAGRHRVSGRSISGDGFAVAPGTSLALDVDVPPDARLVFATTSESLVLDGSDHPARSTQRFRVRLGDTVLLEHEQECTETGTLDWHTLPLPAGGAPGARLTFEVEGALAYTAFLSPTIAPSDVGGYAERPWGARRPDLVVFLADTLRADALGAYDRGRFRPPGVDLTPALDRFAAEARTFTEARSVGTWTLPAIASIVTGLFPHQTGADDMAAALPEDVGTLAEQLQEAGYRTVAVTEGGFVSKQHGFARGFSAFCEGAPDLEATVALARGAVAADDGRPLFLFVHTFRAHGPYEVSPATRARLGDALGVTEEDTWEALWPLEEGAPPDAVERLRALYLGGIADLDAGFDTFRRLLGEAGLLDSGYVLFTSDHGESFEEHGELLHTGPPHEVLVRVPLILSGPRIAAGHDEAPASLIDIAPTLLSLAGLPPRPDHAGSSLLALDPDRPTFAFECATPGAPSHVAVVQSERKVIGTTLSGMLDREVRAAYDLRRDPAETDNLADEEVPWTRELFEEHADALGDFLIPRFVSSEAGLDPLHRAELEALGYVDG